MAGGLQTGTTFVDGNTYVAADLNNAVNNATPLPTLITQWSQKTTPIDADQFLLSDSANSGALVYTTLGNIRTGLGTGKVSYSFTDTGSANAYAFACTPTITTLTTGQLVVFKPANLNTTTSTLAVDGLASKHIFNVGADLTGGELIPNVVRMAIYDGTQFNLVSKEQVIVGDTGSGGQQGLPPAPAAGDALARRALLASGVWDASTVITPQGRLTLTTGTPVMTADATAQGTIYYTAFRGAQAPIFNGTKWGTYYLTGTATSQELSIALDSNSGHTGYHQSGKIFDLFVFNNSGTITLGTGPAWSSTTARGTGAGTTELQLYNGIWTNKNSIALKIDTTASQVTVGVNQATYVGSFYATANAQTGMAFNPTAASGGTNNILGLWNAHNRVRISSICNDSTTTYTYASSAIRVANNSSSNRCSWIDGLQQSFVQINNQIYPSTAAGAQYGINIDSTSAVYTSVTAQASNAVTISNTFLQTPLLGFHFAQAMEASIGGTTTFQNISASTWRTAIPMEISLEM